MVSRRHMPHTPTLLRRIFAASGCIRCASNRRGYLRRCLIYSYRKERSRSDASQALYRPLSCSLLCSGRPYQSPGSVHHAHLRSASKCHRQCRNDRVRHCTTQHPTLQRIPYFFVMVSEHSTSKVAEYEVEYRTECSKVYDISSYKDILMQRTPESYSSGSNIP